MGSEIEPAVTPAVDVVAELDVDVGRVVEGVVVEESPKVAFGASRLKSYYSIRRGRVRELTGPDARVKLRKLNSIELFCKPCTSCVAGRGLISNQHCSPS